MPPTRHEVLQIVTHPTFVAVVMASVVVATAAVAAAVGDAALVGDAAQTLGGTESGTFVEPLDGGGSGGPSDVGDGS